MKTILNYIAICMVCLPTLTSCWSSKEIGRLNLVSVRNIDSKTDYQMLQKNVEYTMKQAKKIKAGNIEGAVDEVVKKVDGGEYLMNAKITLISRQGLFSVTSGYVVEGDVWGIKTSK